MNKTTGQFETADGNVHDGIRIMLQDKLQLERTARVKKWDVQESPFTTTAFLVWHAARREKLTELSFEEFSEQIVDATMDTEGDDDSDLAQS